MLKFGRFKTSFNVYNGKKRNSNNEIDSIANVISINGAYRVNRDEFFINNGHAESQRKLTPSVPIPPSMPPESIPSSLRQAKSTSDLIKNKNLPPSLRQSQSGISLDPRGTENDIRNPVIENNKQLDAEKRVEKKRIEEQKKLEKKQMEEHKKLNKQRLEEEKKREKLAMQERIKQEKLKKEREKRDAQQIKKDKNIKNAAPQKPLANPLAQTSSQATNSSGLQNDSRYSTNTLDSSISRTTGPPPYSENPNTSMAEKEHNNVTFGKPIETDSWDMISQHRQDMNIKKPVITATHIKGKVTTLDLNFTLGEQSNKDNSEV